MKNNNPDSLARTQQPKTDSEASAAVVPHTPGPWSLGLIVKGERFVEVWSDPAEKAICKVWHGGSKDELDRPIKAEAIEEKANARLIVAAPELLDALKALMTYPRNLEKRAAAELRANAVIAKADGRS